MRERRSGAVPQRSTGNDEGELNQRHHKGDTFMTHTDTVGENRLGGQGHGVAGGRPGVVPQWSTPK